MARLIFAVLALSSAALVIAILAASVGFRVGSTNSAGAATVSSIAVDDYRFTPNRIDASVGRPLTVTLTNVGTEQHDLSFPSIHMPGLGGVESILAPGETRQITLEFDQPGYHTFVCAVPGHAAAGMSGVVFVQP